MDVNLKKIPHKLKEPKKPSNSGVILIPGISGKALISKIYSELGKELMNAGFSFLRFDLWKSEKDLIKLSISDIHSFLDKAVEFMWKKGHTELSFVGKSFGGGVLLTYKNLPVNKMVLLAPAIKFGEESNFSEAKKKKLSEFKHFMNIKINKRDVVACPILIIHGTADEIVPIENSEGICKQLPNCKLVRVGGAGHSYKKEREMKVVIKETIAFLKNPRTS